MAEQTRDQIRAEMREEIEQACQTAAWALVDQLRLAAQAMLDQMDEDEEYDITARREQLRAALHDGFPMGASPFLIVVPGIEAEPKDQDELSAALWAVVDQFLEWDDAGEVVGITLSSIERLYSIAERVLPRGEP